MKQLPLNLRDPRYRRPTMDVAAAKGALDLTEDEVVDLVDTGALIAWNIATPRAERRELRILTASVAEYQTHCSGVSVSAAPSAALYHSNISPDAAISAVLPTHPKPFLTGIEIQRALNCSSTHVIKLIETKALKILPGTDYQRGPKGSPCISRAIFTLFLKSRMEGAL